MNQNFEWQAEPLGNDTSSPSASLNLLFNSGTNSPAETGLKLASNGLITFAAGQAFPGAGSGTVTSVGSGTGLTGGPITGSGTLSLAANACASGSALSALPFTCSPFATLGANTFTGNQIVNANVTATNVTATQTVSGGIVNATTGFDLQGSLFDFGSLALSNAFLGFAGNTTTTGPYNTASGAQALFENTTGTSNTASGYGALYLNTAGISNTAVGVYAGLTSDSSHITGSNNTLLGAAGYLGTGTLTNATAIGAFAEVTESNALILGSINGVNFANSSVNVGIGTTAPTHALEVNSQGATSAQMAMITSGTDAALSLKNTASGGREYWIDSGSGSAGVGAGNLAIYDSTAGVTRLVVNQEGNVGIGTTSPDNTLSVNGSADKPGGGSWGTFSDARLKDLNGSFSSGLSQVLQLNPVRYRYKPGNAMGIRDTDEHIGVVAQEVQQVIPEAVTENSKGYLLVNNDPIIWSMLNAIKEQQGQIKQLQEQAAEIRSLKAEVQEARETLRQVRAQVAAAQLTVVAAK